MEKIVYFYPKGHESHQETGHPERPDRVEVIRKSLSDAGMWDSYRHLPPEKITMDFLKSTHEPQYLQALQVACQRGAHLDMDTYTTTTSWDLALNAVGGAIAVAKAVWNGESQTGFALTRPPGHHATSRRGMGFCLMNNIALAADYLLSDSSAGFPKAERLVIIDLDLHHGNGTQEIFWKRNDVFYISTHQSPHYPGTGRLEEIGEGLGEDFTANFPFPPFTGDEGFRTTMEALILPLLDRYSPQMILVSFGFDPHWRDPLGQLMISARVYGELISSLVKWADQHCQGKIALFLEGGYDLVAGAACAQTAAAALLNQPIQDPLGPSTHPEGDSWRVMLKNARQLWDL